MTQNSKQAPEKILVVDDDPVIRDMMQDMLEMEGYDMRLARNGKEALEVLQGQEKYLVFLDLMMPIMDGSMLCQVLRERGERQRHTIVIMSAKDNLPEVEDLHPDATMPKPFIVDDVLAYIEQYIG